MNYRKCRIKLILSVIMMIIGCTVVPSCRKRVNDSVVINVIQYDSLNCTDLMRLRTFLKMNYPNLNIKNTLSTLSDKDKRVINADHDIFFRFLSLISGKPTPYNLEVDHYSVKNLDWLESSDNIQLAEWYEGHQDLIHCAIFSEYYNIEKGISEGPKSRVGNFDEYLKASEEFFDSVYCKKDKFEKEYSGYLSEESIK